MYNDLELPLMGWDAIDLPRASHDPCLCFLRLQIFDDAGLADIRSRTAEQPQHPTQSPKAWLRHQNGFLGLSSSPSEVDSDLAAPAVHLQVSYPYCLKKRG